MPSGIDPVHRMIMQEMWRACVPLTANEVHNRAAFGSSPSIEGVGRRLATLSRRGWVEKVGRAWMITNDGREAVATDKI